MPIQKTFKQRVRARMIKTGESYTTARHQLLRKTAPGPAVESVAAEPIAPAEAAPEVGAPGEVTDEIPEEALLVADDAMVRATGSGHAEWFAILDGWGATGHTHTEIAQWLRETHGTSGWWSQNITVAYERARGMRARHQMANGFTVGATRTLAVEADRALQAFTDERLRREWLGDRRMERRPTRAARTARFDWAEPPSRVVVTVDPKEPGRATIAVAHEQLPDAETGDRLKAAWRGWLGDLKTYLESN